MWAVVREPCEAAKGVEDAEVSRAEVSRAVWAKVRAPSGAAGPGRATLPTGGAVFRNPGSRIRNRDRASGRQFSYLCPHETTIEQSL